MPGTHGSGQDACPVRATPSMFSLRRAQPADLPAILAVQAQCYAPQLNEPPSIWQQRLQHPAALCWVAEAQATAAPLAYLAGYPACLGSITALNGDFLPATAANCLYLHDLAVSPVANGHGLGGALVAEALRMAHARQWPHAALVCVQDAAPFWHKQGFTVTEPATGESRAALATYPGAARYMTRALPVQQGTTRSDFADDCRFRQARFR